MGSKSAAGDARSRCGAQERGVGCGSLMELQALDLGGASGSGCRGNRALELGGSGSSPVEVRLWAAPIPPGQDRKSVV